MVNAALPTGSHAACRRAPRLRARTRRRLFRTASGPCGCGTPGAPPVTPTRVPRAARRARPAPGPHCRASSSPFPDPASRPAHRRSWIRCRAARGPATVRGPRCRRPRSRPGGSSGARLRAGHARRLSTRGECTTIEKRGSAVDPGRGLRRRFLQCRDYQSLLDCWSPEQIGGKRLDSHSHLDALGCVTYRCLNGSPSFVHHRPPALGSPDHRTVPDRNGLSRSK